jgi:single-stranded DNA-binding protein
MARDINSVVLTGTVSRPPQAVRLKSGKQICLFTLKNVEKYELADRTPAEHRNFLSIEVFGKNVDRTLNEVREGERYVIHGYIRVDDIDGVEKVRVRAFNIQKE